MNLCKGLHIIICIYSSSQVHSHVLWTMQHTHTHACSCARTCMHARTYAWIHTHTHTRACAHTHTHRHTHTHKYINHKTHSNTISTDLSLYCRCERSCRADSGHETMPCKLSCICSSMHIRTCQLCFHVECMSSSELLLIDLGNPAIYPL